MKPNNIIKSMVVTTSVQMSKFIKHHKAKPSIREQKTQQRESRKNLPLLSSLTLKC
jgi:hypothetical protein